MKIKLTGIAVMLCMTAEAQEAKDQQLDTMKTQNIQNVTITARRVGTRRMKGPDNAVLINREELFKAACCNLGESFTTNPSVDVNYSDAATGAKQIRLLGLSGTYEQVSAQITRWFRHWSVYIGGENLTGFRQKQTIIHAEDPWSGSFDPTMVWGPVHGAMFYAGIRINIGRL